MTSCHFFGKVFLPSPLSLAEIPILAKHNFFAEADGEAGNSSSVPSVEQDIGIEMEVSSAGKILITHQTYTSTYVIKNLSFLHKL